MRAFKIDLINGYSDIYIINNICMIAVNENIIDITTNRYAKSYEIGKSISKGEFQRLIELFGGLNIQ